MDAREGVTTGISAADRAHTIRLLADPATDAGRPGPARPRRPAARHARAACCAGPGTPRPPSTWPGWPGCARPACSARSSTTTAPWRGCPSCGAFADEHGLALISIADLIAYRRRTERQVAPGRRGPAAHRRTASSSAVGYRSTVDGTEHVALVYGDIGDGEDVLVRVHSECLTGDVFGSLRCDCGPQLHAALAAVAAEGRGVVLYMRGHEGRGIGLLHKLQAYQLQDAGRATPSTPTSSSACRPTPATTAPARRSWSTSACARCGCSPTTRPSGPGWRATG